MSTETWTKEQLLDHLSEHELNTPAVRENFNRWLERGDGIAVYQNVDFGSSQMGHCQYASFGSPAAQLEVEEPPLQLPDIGAQINWRYRLRATYKGETL